MVGRSLSLFFVSFFFLPTPNLSIPEEPYFFFFGDMDKLISKPHYSDLKRGLKLIATCCCEN